MVKSGYYCLLSLLLCWCFLSALRHWSFAVHLRFDGNCFISLMSHSFLASDLCRLWKVLVSVCLFFCVHCISAPNSISRFYSSYWQLNVSYRMSFFRDCTILQSESWTFALRRPILYCSQITTTLQQDAIQAEYKILGTVWYIRRNKQLGSLQEPAPG